MFIHSSLNILSVLHPLEVGKLDSLSVLSNPIRQCLGTLLRWIKNVMIKSGIDIGVFILFIILEKTMNVIRMFAANLRHSARDET